MRAKAILSVLLLLVASIQTAAAQGFRVYKSDGTIMQFSLRTDSIVFYDGIGSDIDFGPFTPVNQCIAGTWYKSKSETVTFNEDGTTDYIDGATYEFMPYQGTIIIYNASGIPVNYLKVLKVTDEQLMIGASDGSAVSVWSTTSSSTLDPGNHEWVDLGLPSGTLWATKNVGAPKPEEYGSYFAWGETKPKGDYNWSTYKWMNAGQSSWSQINKYTFADGQKEACWYDGEGNFIGDGKTEFDPEDDAATANWGSDWQMPSLDQIKELINSEYTKTEWTRQGGVNGRLITSKSNGNSIFLPAAGCRYGTSLIAADSGGYYWSRSLSTNYSGDACGLIFNSGDIGWSNNYRYYGQSVRPVRVN